MARPDAGSGTDGASGDGGADAGPPPPLRIDDFSPPARAAIEVLQTSFASDRGTGWDYFGDLMLEPGGVLQTPPADHWGQPLDALEVAACTNGCDPDLGLQPCATQSDCTEGGLCRLVEATVTQPGAAPARLCAGHSDALYDEVYRAIASAERVVDVTSLSPPDGRFEAAIRNALTYLSRTGRAVRVRLLFGNIIGGEIDTDMVLANLTRDLEPGTAMSVSVGAYRIGVESWNHSKIVAVDGQTLIEGGHNYYTDHYLRTSPVHDLSLRVSGAIAITAHTFSNPLWTYVCEGHTITGYTGLSTYPSSAPPCPPSFAEPPPRERLASGARVIALGRYGDLGADPSDAARLAMFDAATTRIDLSLQDLGPLRVGSVSLGDWPEPILEAFGRAIARGVDVRVVLSTPGSTPGGLGGSGNAYGNGWTAEDAAQAMRMWLERNPSVVPPGTSARDLVCARFHATTLRASSDDAWPDGATLGNHTKYFMVDDVAFYVGSHNLYDADLAEFGLVVDDPAAARVIRDQYWAPMWEQSRRVAVSGSEAPRCLL